MKRCEENLRDPIEIFSAAAQPRLVLVIELRFLTCMKVEAEAEAEAENGKLLKRVYGALCRE